MSAEGMGVGGIGNISSFILFYDSIAFSQKVGFVSTQVTFNTNPGTRGLIQYLNCSGKLFKNCFCIYILQSEKGQSWKSTTNCDRYKWKKT